MYGTFPLPTSAAPIVSGEDWSGVGLSSVTLTGKINPRSLDTTYQFEYGTDPTLAGASSVPVSAGNAGSGFLPVNVSGELTGLQQSTTYYYRLVTHSSFGGGGGSTVDGPIQSFTTLAPLPAALTDGVSELSSSAAVVSGTVTPGSSGAASTTMYCFEYGVAGLPGYNLGFLPGEPTGDAGQGEAAVAVSVRLSPLQSGTTYRYRLIAVNSLGLRQSSTACSTQGGREADGAEGQFTTSATGPSPVVETGSAVDVAQSTATLTGTVDPEGVRTVYYFQIGTSTEYGVDLFGEAGSGMEGEGLSVPVSSLQPGTTYHYRLVASNSNGGSYGSDEAFTTPGVPSSMLSAPVTALLVGTPDIAFPTGSQANTGATETKKLTDTQKLAKALKACAKKRPERRRASCEKAARKNYAPRRKKK